MSRQWMGTRRAGARVEQLHRVEMDTIPQIYIDILVSAGGCDVGIMVASDFAHLRALYRAPWPAYRARWRRSRA